MTRTSRPRRESPVDVPTVLNPDAIGDPNQTPIVQLPDPPAPTHTPAEIDQLEVQRIGRERRATLRVQSAKGTGQDYYVKLTASNGETLGTGETHPDPYSGVDSRAAWLRAFAEILEDEGYTVEGPA
jgi:hypothetical protein